MGTISDRCAALRTTHRRQSIGKRACHHFSQPIGRLAGLGGGATASWRHLVNMTDLSRRCFGPTSRSLPSFLVPTQRYRHPFLSSVPLAPHRCVHISTCFFAPRNRLPVGRMYRYAAAVHSVEQRWCIRVSTSLNMFLCTRPEAAWCITYPSTLMHE